MSRHLTTMQRAVFFCGEAGAVKSAVKPASPETRFAAMSARTVLGAACGARVGARLSADATRSLAAFFTVMLAGGRYGLPFFHAGNRPGQPNVPLRRKANGAGS
ncbi:hypothetical protein [Caballeronia grimmiae]|uniref:hypothetical protein n=1 Tax=Caballeronia grimmiae TaxID=1071679 RepID=UPI0038BDD936